MTIRTVAAGCFMVVFGAGVVNAQSQADTDVPAEHPPASFQGSQYVDSRGCAFIRAGVDGNVVWVPRVARDRRLLCGLEPSLAQVAAAPQAATAEPAEMADTTAAADPVTTAPEVAATPAPAPTPAATETAAPVVTPAPNPVVAATAPAAKPKLKPRAKPVTRKRKPAIHQPKAAGPMLPPVEPQTACVGGNRVSQGYVGNPDQDFPVRCGPQEELPYYTGVTEAEMKARPKRAAKPAARPQPQQKAQTQARQQKRGGPLETQGQYVQVATFAVAENAAATAKRMESLGLPSLVGQYVRGGVTYRIVLVGPIGAADARAAALARVRGAGFRDAFLR